MCINRGPTDQRLGQLDVQGAGLLKRAQHLNRLGSRFGSDAVTR